MKTRLSLSVLLIALLAWPALAGPPAQPLDENAAPAPALERLPIERAPGDPVDFAAALAAGATYLRVMQADITDDNAGNGINGVDETPDDPDDAGWDWLVNLAAPLHHTTALSPTNIYGATVQGLLAAYLGGGGGGGAYFTALSDAAGVILAGGTTNLRTSSDMIFLMEFDDLPEVAGNTYADAARAKYDARIAAQGSATAFAQYVRDMRGVTQGYPNGIIGWDLGSYAKVAAMLDARYPGNGYDTQADDIAEVLWQDSFNDNPGLFDVVDDAGWDPTWTNANYWWYTLGLTGLIDAFHASGSHTAEIAGLVARLEASTFSTGAVSGSYGANATDEDWQSTAYTAMSLAYLDRPGHQGHINRLAYWIGATQDGTGAWAYSSGDHYPEVGGENTAALALGQAPSTVIVDDDFLGQTEVDLYNEAHSTNYVYGYDAFGSIQAGIDAVSGSTVNVAAGTYVEQLHITTNDLAIIGAGVGATIVKSPASCPAYFITGASTQNHPVVFVDGATGVALSHLTIDGDHQGTANYRFSGLAFWNAGGSLTDGEVLNVMDTAFSGAQHGVGIYAYNTTGGPYAIALNDVQVLDFQKNGIALLGDGLTVDLDGVTTTGQGPTTVTAQNGIQIGLGTSGTVDDCVISDVAYTGASWTATGFLLQEGGTVTATNVDIDGCQTSVYWIDTNGSYNGSAITNPIGDAFYAYSSGGAKSALHPRVAAQPLSEDYKTSGGRSAVTAAVTNCTITGTGLANSAGVYAFSEEDGPVDFTVTGCTISNWDLGVVCYDWDDTIGSIITAEIHDNDFIDNTSYGVYAFTANTQDATDNWWGHASGPYHPTANPYGLGDPVSDFVDFDPFTGQATFGIAASTNGPINCSQSSTLTFSYDPDLESPAMRGCSVRVPVSPYLAFTEADFHVNPAIWPTGPGGASSFFDVTYDGIAEAYVVDYGILGTTPGITAAVDLFTLVADGAATGSGVVMVDSCSVRDLVNQPIGADCSDAETILVDCTAPDLPEMNPEPAFTQGLTNPVSWSDESGSGAVAYYAECATDAGFGTVIANTGWIAGFSHNFTGLTDATPYWYRVKAKDALDNETGWSAAVSSTQDDLPPVTAVGALAGYQNSLTFDVTWGGSDATSGIATVALWYDNGGGWTAGGSSPTSPISFTAPADGVYGFYSSGTDIVGNVEAAPGAADQSTIVDTTLPAGTFAIAAGAVYTNTLAVTLTNAVTDTNPLEMRFSNDGASWSSWTAYTAGPAWTLAAGADGPRTVYAEFRDAAQWVLALNDAIVYDTTAPGMASAINAEPRHEEVALTWTDPGDADLASLEIWRALWHDGALNSAYPDYGSLTGNVFPDRPADRANADISSEWTQVGSVAAGVESFFDVFTAPIARGVYIYEVFPVDIAGNYGPRAVTGNDYATNYWLGDVYPGWDGNVNVSDITSLGTSYGLEDGESGYDNECDVGPTTHPAGSGLGIPLTDDVVGFEDLMIFALNYGNVGPAPVVAGSDIAMLSWFEMEDGVWGLGLSEPCANLKALQLKSALPASALVQLAGGGLLNQQAGPVFLRQIPGDGLDVSLAVLGEGLVISGQGLLFSVTLPAGLVPGDVELTVRDAANAELAFALSATAVEDLPTVYRLAGNYPNPFNPKTTIGFDLPEAQFVRLAVFSADGRRIATLLSQQMAAGRHNASWDGRDEHGDQVASGVYFARIEAGPLQETHKMLLMK